MEGIKAYDVVVIGAGPCGSYTAYLLARFGFRVGVFEEHKRIGEPVQCTGIASSALEKVIELKKDFVVNTIDTTRVYAPNNDFVEIKLKKNIILDRKSFDNYLAEKAVGSGAKFFLNNKFLFLKRTEENIVVKIRDSKNKIKELKTKILIGADGPLSTLAKSSGMFGKRSFFIGLQNIMREENNNTVEFYPLKEGIGWVVPENENMVRAGIAVRENVRNKYNYFITKRFGKDYAKRMVGQQAGLIPLYNPKLTTQKQNIFLVGDAATQVKATTLGGIVPGLMAAKALAKSIIKYENYETNWKRVIGKELWLSLIIRKILDGFSDKDYNKLISICNNDKIKKILYRYERDFPSKFLIKMILTQPRLLYFGKYFYKLF